MALRIFWTLEAETTFSKIIQYLEQNWTEKEIKHFIVRTNVVISNVKNNPHLYRKSNKRNVHQAVITKHNSLFYKISDDRIELLTFWDTRQNPNKLRL